MALWVRCRGNHTLGVDLEDRRAGNDAFIVELGARLGQDDIDLACNAGGDSVNLVVGVAGSNADLNWELQKKKQLVQWVLARDCVMV